MLKRIELNNFMSHRHTVIEPADGLTVLVGPNNCGKSAFVAALQILAYNETSTYVCRHGQDTVSIRVTTDDGHDVQWKRVKKSPRYTINGETFDRLRSGNHRESLSKALRINPVQCDSQDIDIHFGEQKSPVFLLRDSAKNAADFFASSSDAGRLMKMQARHKQKVQEAKTEKKRLSQEAARLMTELASMAPIEQISNDIEKADVLASEIKELDVRAEHLTLLIRGLIQLENKQKAESARIKSLRQVVEPPALECTKSLEHISAKLPVVESLVARASEEKNCISKLLDPPAIQNTNLLESTHSDLLKLRNEHRRRRLSFDCLSTLNEPPKTKQTSELQTAIEKIKSFDVACCDHSTLIERLSRNIGAIESDVVDWTSRNPICPTCRSPVEANRLLNASGINTSSGCTSEERS